MVKILRIIANWIEKMNKKFMIGWNKIIENLLFKI